MPGKLPSLRGVVGFSVADDDVQSWDAFLSRGQHALLRLRAELARREELLTCDDLATIMFTSGTTGEPKGVMLTHGNLLSNATASLELSPRAPDAVVLSWLPYTHIYARTIDHYGCLVSGSLLCLAGSAETLIDDLAEVRPTNFASVPRFYEKVLSAQTDAAPSKRADRLRRVFGDRLDWMSSGGAPLPVGIARAYLDAGLPLLQGYGLTETSPVISFNTKEHHRLGSVGRALPGVDVRIADDGEILTRGPHVMRGYWQDADATAAAIRDGWFHTGDLGSLDADGYLFITGRKKELMVLSNGKKVVPSYLEGLLLTDPCFDQVMICGEGRNFISALVVPHWANVAAALHWDAGKSALPTERRAELPEVQQLLEERANRASADVASFEQVRKIAILPQPFTVAADELTVSLKLRRAVILEHYAARIEAIYQEVTNFGKCMDS